MTTPFRPGAIGPSTSTRRAFDLSGHEAAGRVAAPLGDEPGLGPELGGPGGDVRCLASGTGLGDGGRVVAARQVVLEPDDQVEHQVAESSRGSLVQSSHGRRTTGGAG